MSFEISKPSINIKDTVQYLVTRPIEAIVDDGRGNYNISPIGFPVRNVSSTLGVIPTRVTPEFILSYKNVMDSAGFSVDYIATSPISDLYGIQTKSISLNSITRVSGTATAISTNAHGYVTGATVVISGAGQSEYNGSYSVTVIDDYTFTYVVTGSPASPATGIITASYTMIEDSIVQLVAQDDKNENGYYVVNDTVWRVLYLVANEGCIIVSNIYDNINITNAVPPLVEFDIASITVENTGVDLISAIVITTLAHGFSSGTEITIANSVIPSYNGDFIIDVINAYTFRYKIPTDLGSDLSGIATASYQTVINDLVLLTAQSDSTENGIYYVNSGTNWVFFGDFYKYNGTENDNVAGDYGKLADKNGNALTHYRNGYSLKETTDFLRLKLNNSVEFGKFKGSNHALTEQGSFVQWLMSGRKVNIGDIGNKEVYIDGFGLGNPNNLLKNARVDGDIDPLDSVAVASKQSDVSRYRKMALWGLSNHHSRTLDGYNDKSPIVKDYPFIYNSEYDASEIEPQLSGGHVDLTVDVERMRISITGTTSTTDVNTRPIAIDTLWYQRDNAYHNNITLDMSNQTTYGKHSISIINNFDTPDYVGIYTEEFTNADITTGAIGIITLEDVSELKAGDYVRFMIPMTSVSPIGISRNTTYKIASGYPSGQTIALTDMNDVDISITSTGSGVFTLQRVSFDLYKNDEVVTSLNDIESITLNSGLKIIKIQDSGVCKKYYFKPRAKQSLNSIATKGSWTVNTLSYDANGTNGINIYLNSAETDFITFMHDTKTTAELLSDLNDNNNLIPVPFDSNLSTEFLTELFVDSTIIDHTNPINQTEKIRSKKTFIHLPTSLDLADGTPIDIDVSLPTVPYTDSFAFNTVGCLSGYKNYVTQPRAYIFGGYQDIHCDLIPVTSIFYNQLQINILTTTNHGLHTVVILDSEINTLNSTITPKNWKDISVGDWIAFTSTGTLPTTSPQITTNTKYKIKSIVDGSISLQTEANVDILISSVGTGNLLMTLCHPVKLIIKGSSASEYNTEFIGTIDSANSIYIVPTSNSYSASVTNAGIYISKATIVHGTEGIYGLTERNNSAIFGSMPEVEHSHSSNIYHQTFTPDILNGSPYSDSNGDIQLDKRVLLATVYPTSTSTFQWRIDNDPQLRMLQWSMLNVNAGGGSDLTGSVSNVAYKRNKRIFNEFNTVYKDGNNGLFSVYDNPLSYVSSLSPSFTQQQLNALVRVRFPDTIGSVLDSVDSETVGSFNYQASVAYIDLVRDFITSRVKVNDVKSEDELIYILQENSDFILSEDGNSHLIAEYGAINELLVPPSIISYQVSLPGNHGTSYIPASFYDQSTDHEFLVFDSVVNANSDSNDNAEDRWMTKGIYVPNYIYNASGETAMPSYDPFKGMPSALTNHFTDYYFIPSKPLESNAGNRYVVGDLHPSIDPTFEFGYGSTNKFLAFASTNVNSVTLSDIKRRFWDSYYEIPSATQRQMQNAFYIADNGVSIEDCIKFHGSNWIPFAKVFSTDVAQPISDNITDITDYASIIAGSTGAAYTLTELLKSNPIATRFKANGYYEAYTANTITESNTAIEDFLRNYVAGYSNKLPNRFYNGYRIAVNGNTTSTSYSTDLTNPVINTESDAERIYRYALRDYLTEYSSSPSSDNGTYMDDNFLLYNNAGITSATSLYDAIESGYVSDNNGTSTLTLYNWESLDDWTIQTGQLWIPAGTGYVSNGNLYSSVQNPFYRYNIPVSDTFVVESYITPQDDQSLYFCSHRADPTMINWYTARELSYFGLVFEESPAVGDSYQLQAIVRKNDSPIMYDYEMTTMPYNPDRLYRHIDEYDIIPIATYTPGTQYRVLFARQNTSTFMVKVYVASTNELLCSYSTSLTIPNANGFTTDDLDLLLCPGRYGGYYSSQSFAINITANQVDAIFGLEDPNTEIVVRDFNPSWWYFEKGNPNTDPINSTIKSAITVSGMNYLADREFFLNKMQFNYTRVKMSFIFSSQLGRWLPLDYRQAPTAYLTPTFGATALRQREKSIVYSGKSGMNVTDYVPITYTDGTDTINTIDEGTYPIDSTGATVLDYLWKNPICSEPNSVNSQLSLLGYWEMIPMELNKFCYPFLSSDLPYDSSGVLVDAMNLEIDVYGSDSYKFTRLIEPNQASDVGINFVVPNNVHGGSIDANNDLFMYQPHMWKVYWHMRPAVCAMDGTDIPSANDRTGGVMADPVLNNIFTYPNPRDPQFYIPWHENMGDDWLNSGWLVIDGRIRNKTTNPTRDKYYEFDAKTI